jgi:phenylalanyl-tRNA synthetase beta subunit
MGVEPQFAALESPGFIPGRAASVRISNRQSSTAGSSCGVLGEVHPAVLAAFGITQPVAVFEAELDAVMKGGPGA